MPASWKWQNGQTQRLCSDSRGRWGALSFCLVVSHLGGEESSHLELSMVDLGCSRGHLVLQICQFGLICATVDAAGSILQLSQLAFEPIHGARRQVHLQRGHSLELVSAGQVGPFQGTRSFRGEGTRLNTGDRTGNAPMYKLSLC